MRRTAIGEYLRHKSLSKIGEGHINHTVENAKALALARRSRESGGFFLLLRLALVLLISFSSCAAQAQTALLEQPPEKLLGHPEDIPGEKPLGLRFRQEDWNQMRRDIEAGREPGQLPPSPSEVFISTTPPKEAPLQPPPGRLQVELPFESTLSITGRKLIQFNIRTTEITAERAQRLGIPQRTQTVEMKQELQARIQGTVGRKTTVNVNYDDTKENTRDFSVVYKGDPDELVQEAAFGDIVLSLPNTEFVNYNKQLFGLRGHLKYKKVEVYAIGSRTKGTTETKRFSGSTTRVQQDIIDTAYIRRSFYDLTFPNTSFTNGDTVLPIVPGSEKVFVDDQNPFNNTPNTQRFNVETSTGGVLTGDFDQLAPGRDYIVDYSRGVVNFLRPLASNVLVAVDFTFKSGSKLSNKGAQPTLRKVLKDIAETPGITQELKTFYSIGQPRIVRDNGRGNFILRVLDLNRTEVGSSIGVFYPDQITVNFEQGTFFLNKPLPNSDIYNPSPTHRFTFFLEYQFQVKTYSLRPNIVLQSERVTMNGKPLARDVDYIIDYDLGQVTFLHPEDINDSTIIEATYEFAPFGSQLGDTIVGTRGVLNVVPSWKIGSSVLYNFAPKPLDPPDVRSLPQSTLVMGADTQIDKVKVPFLPVVSTFRGEVAQSRLNPDTFDKAIIESFEGLKQEDQASMLTLSWQVGSNPSGGTAVTYPPDLLASNETSRVSDRNPSVTGQNDLTEQVLRLDYSLKGGPIEQASINQVFSPIGRDFSKKQTFEIWVNGAGSKGTGMDLIADLGLPNEDADGSGTLKTEDTNHDGFLQPNEDIGWIFHFPGIAGVAGSQDFQIGARNGQLDTDDLNRNGRLDPEQMVRPGTPTFQLSKGLLATNPVTQQQETIKDLSFTGWRVFQIPLNIQQSEIQNWQAVVAVRLTLRNATQQFSGTATDQQGTIRVGKLSLVGNSFEPAVASVSSSTASVQAVNNIDNPEYQPLTNDPRYQELYPNRNANGQQTREQALQLSFSLSPGASATTREIFSVPRDFSRLKKFKFFAQLPSGSASPFTLFLQIGSDTQFLEYNVKVDRTDPNWNGWKLLTADLSNNNWSTSDPGAATTVAPGGPPSLTQISQIKIGVRNGGSSTIQSKVWVDEIHESDADTRTGLAQKYSLDNTLPGWATFGGSLRDVNRNFQTPSLTVTNQDNRQENAYINVTKLKYLPFSFTTGRTRAVTPNAVQTGSSQLVSILEQGEVNTLTQNLKGQLLIPKLPVLGLNYDRAKTQTTLLRRTDDRQTLSASLDYAVPWKPNILSGGAMTLRPLPTNASLTASRQLYFLQFGSKDDLLSHNLSTQPFVNTNSVEITNGFSAKMGFLPWDGFRMDPSYSLKVIEQENRFRDDEFGSANTLGKNLGPAQRFPKGKSFTAGLGGSLRILSWLEPQINYNTTTTETNQLPSISSTTAFNLKNIDRSGSANISWAFLARQVFPKSKLLQSFSSSSSYLLENGDSYQNVGKDFNTLGQLWVGSPLPVSNPEALRTQFTRRGTLKLLTNWTPLEAYPMSYRLSPFRTMNLTNSFTDTREHKETTGTTTESKTTIFPDLVLTLRDTEKLYRMERTLTNSRLTLKGSYRKAQTFGINTVKNQTIGSEYLFTILRMVDLAASYNTTTSEDFNEITQNLNSTGKTQALSTQLGWTRGFWRYTPRFDYSLNQSQDASGRLTTDLTTKSYSLQIFGDISRPLSIKLPFLRNPLGLSNRLLVTSNLKLEQKRTSLNVAQDYTDTYSFTLSGDYAISQNFRLTLGAGFSQVRHQEEFKELNVKTYDLTTALTIQF